MQDGLWWLSLSARQREAVRKAVLLGAVLAALGGLEGRVIFRAFGQYIMLHPPWSYLVVTIALYGTAALLAMHFAGTCIYISTYLQCYAHHSLEPNCSRALTWLSVPLLRESSCGA